MIVVNTTFHASAPCRERFVAWLKEHYIPVATAQGVLSRPRLALILTGEDDGAAGDASLALQFEAESLDAISAWYDSTGRTLTEQLSTEFADGIAGFSTLMQTID